MRNLKKALSLALASVMVLGMTVVGSNAAFADVDANDHKEAIDVMQLIEVMVGDQNGNFNPDQKVTRNEMAVIIAKMMDLPLGGNHPFKDVPAWADKYVAALYNNRITGGIGANKYGGNNTITAKEAGLMMMKALGYFVYDGEYGDDWSLATIRQANKINLFKGMGVFAGQQLTRNDVALLALNALKSNVVVTEEKGGLDVNVNGNGNGSDVHVNQKPDYVYNPVPETDSYIVHGTDGLQQLAEKLYGSDLKLNTTPTTTDAFKRPAAQWTYKADTVTSPKAADKVYTAPVKFKDIAADLGVASTTEYKIFKNGADGSLEKDKVGANGDVIEAYLADDAKSVKLVVVSTYFGEVKKVNNDGKVNRAVVIDNKEYETDAFAKGDKVLYTVADSKIQSVALVGAQKAGTITKKVGDDLYIDGVKTDVNAACASKVEAVKAGDKVEYYVDANGYIVELKIAEAAVTLDKVGFLAEIGKNAGVGAKTQVRLVMADGTEKILNVENTYVNDKSLKGKNSKDQDVELFNTLVSYSEKDGKFTLKSVDQKDATVTGWKNNSPVMGDVKLDNTTVFVYAITDKNNKTTYETYTGYRNALSAKNDSASFTFAAKVNDKGFAELVYVAVNDAAVDHANSVKNWIVVVGDPETGKTVTEDLEYYEYVAIVDGKVTTVKVANQVSEIQFAKSYTTDKDGIVSYTAESKVYQGEETGKPVEIAYKNGVIVVSKDKNADANTEEMEEVARLNPSKDIVVVEVASDRDSATLATLDSLSKGTEMYSAFNWVIDKDNNEVQMLVAIVK